MGTIIQYLPYAIVAVVGGTAFITFYLSYVVYEHVTYMLPYISDTGTFPPESCIFAQSLNIAAILIFYAVYLKYLQVQEIFHKHHIEDKYNVNQIACFFGYVAGSGMSLVGNFQETSTFVFHWVAAIMTFGGATIYTVLQSYLYIKISPVIGQRKTTMVRIILSVIAMISFIVCTVGAFVAYGQFKGDHLTKWKEEDGGYRAHQMSTHAEWVCATCILVFISLLRKEFKGIVVRPITIIFDEHKHADNSVNNL
ncbi:DNA damage-regulated autophagy modulator protein 2-like [Euwallacea fornicatus]|uniref:DNA damage-regulated autophagy modulator protein 2-like n=1 Tax=Euwallacea fornicatus TaxID=995702 RepID=UPI00338EC9BC